MSTHGRTYRPQVELAKDLVEGMRAYAETYETTLAELCFHWVVTAARLAAHGQGHLLPQRGRYGAAMRSGVGRTVRVRWTQSKSDFAKCRAHIEGAGSSVAAVLRTAGQAYVDAGGDVVAMVWPPENALEEAA